MTGLRAPRRGEPLRAAGLGDACRAALAGCTPTLRRPVADSMPWTMPTWSFAVQQSEAVRPRANTLAGRSETFRGAWEPSLRAAQTWKPAGWVPWAWPTT